MRILRVLRAAAAVPAVLTACESDPAAPADGLVTGAWGGPEAALTVEAHGARVELPCADGRIDGTIELVDRAFLGAGPWWPGPVPPGDPLTAHYSGTVLGDRLLLSIVVQPGGATHGPLELRRDREPTFPRCQ